MSDRATQYASHIAKIRAAEPDYEDLKDQWRKVFIDRMERVFRQQYAELGMSDDLIKKMAVKDTDSYRASLSEEKFKAQLKELHERGVEELVKQLEFERDNPGKEYEQPSNEDGEKSNPLVEAFVAWVGDRILSNFDAAKRESGEGAKILRATLGISWEDIKKHGIFGGSNSFFRKPFG